MKSRGFTLTEVVMTLFIVLVGMLAVAQVIAPAQQGATVTRNRQTAMAMARNVVSLVQSMPFGATPEVMPNGNAPGVAQLSALPGLGNLPAKLSQDGELLEGRALGLEFSLTNVTVTIPSPNCGSVAVTVSWRDAGGNRDVSQETKSLTLVGGLFRD